MSDLISKKALCDYALNQKDKSVTPNDIMRFPSTQPERKKGKWMKEDRGHVEYCAVCDQCGFDWIWSDREYFKFCPNCGAYMRGEQDE